MIRWKSGEYGNYEKILQKYRAKVGRMKKQGLQIPDLYTPKTFSSRKEFERVKTDLNRFLAIKPTATVKTRGGDIVPKWLYEQTKVDVRRINAARATERKKLGIDLIKPRERGLMGRVEEMALKPKKSITKIPKGEFERYAESVSKQAHPRYDIWRKQIFLNNQINAFFYSDVPFSNAELMELNSILNAIGPERYYEYALIDEIPTIGFTYSATDATYRKKLILEYWRDKVGFANESNENSRDILSEG